MDETAIGIAADVNLASTWASLGRSMGGDVLDVESATFVATGLPIAFFNGAFVHGPIMDAARLVAEAVEFFARHSVPWLLWARDGVSPSSLAAGRSAGLRDAGGPPVMCMQPMRDRPSVPPELEITRASSARDVTDHASLLRDGFGMPQDLVDRLISPRLLDDAGLAVFVGRVDGEPVSCSVLSVTGATAGVYNVATPQRFRARGYGEALTWAAIDEGATRDCRVAILQSSDAGYPIYKRMGFVEIGRYLQLEGPPVETA